MCPPRLLHNLLTLSAGGKDLPWEPYTANGRRNVDIVRLYNAVDGSGNGPAAALLRYQPGAQVAHHVHPGYEMVFVLQGVLQDDHGIYPGGTLAVFPPDSTHELQSESGCIFIVVWEQPVQGVQLREAASQIPGAISDFA
jgi:anti-sigma factor ChrR (cupin superfamily)